VKVVLAERSRGICVNGAAASTYKERFLTASFSTTRFPTASFSTARFPKDKLQQDKI
jgi:aspartate 1-decarboxylase